MDTALFGELAAETLLDRLASLSRAVSGDETSSKHVVDYLPFRERRALFGGLADRSRAEVEIVVEDDRFELQALELGEALVIPFLVDEADTWSGPAAENAGSSGFSCALRDYFSVGADRPRILVTLTEHGNETQESARETAVDRELLSFEALCDRLVARYGFDQNSHMQKLVDRYVRYSSSAEAWDERLGRLADFLKVVEDRDPDAWGEELDRLEVFLPDDAPNPIDGPGLDLAGSERERSLDDRCRLDDNAERRAFLEDVLNDPLERTRDQLEQIYDDDSVDDLLEKGIEGEEGVTADEPDYRGDHVVEDASFDWSDVGVEGAAHWERRSGGSDRFLIVTAEDDVRIRAPLDREFDPDREYAHLFGRDRSNEQRMQLDDRVDVDPEVVSLDLPNTEAFSVYKVVLADGPRTFKMTNDEFFVVLSQADGSVGRVAWETGVELSFEHQAWVRQGETATFTVSDGDRKRSDSFEQGSDDLELDDREPGPYDGARVEYVSRGRLADGRLPVRVAWIEEGMTKSEQSLELLAFAPYEGENQEKRDDFLAAMRPNRRESGKAAYLQAITDVSREGDDDWKVELSEQVRATVRRWNDHGQEEAIARLWRDPTPGRLERGPDDSWSRHVCELPSKREAFERARRELFDVLLEESPAVLRDEASGSPVAASPWLTDLTAHREAIETYLEAWLEMVDALADEPGSFGSEHEAVYRLDTLEQRGPDGELERLTVLPTHPWSMTLMLRFQQKVGDLLSHVSNSEQLRTSLTRDELEEFAPKRMLEDWYTSGNQALRAEDGTPFCMEFLPESTFERSGRLDYVSRVVRNKIDRYLNMHDHLRDGRRTFRISFVHPGDARALLDGIEAWFRDARTPNDDWMEEVPTFEIALFEREAEAEAGVETAFDTFFRRYLESTGEAGEVEKAMLAKLRYRRRPTALPREEDDFSHVCFAQGLVEGRDPATGELTDGWDGSFAGGAMATYLRRPQQSGERIEETRRGLWVRGSDPLRRALSHLLQLVEGQRNKFYNPGVGLFWDADLPSMETLSGLYDHSDWVVHLDRELNLAMFHGTDERTRVIEYSDQEDPTQPGFDVITVTERAEPYFEQLRNVLQLVALPKPGPETSASRRPDRESEAMRALLEEINTLSGTWALDFLEGNISDDEAQQRLKGMVGASLVYRWLRRVEEPELEQRFGGDVIPVYVSLEDLIRATPATGLPTGPGLVDRYGESGAHCDDLLALYLQAPPEDPDEPLRLFGRIIEVKFGRSATDSQHKGLEQVRNAHDLMSSAMNGGEEIPEAPIRHRQLSILIKSQLEQAEARGLLSESQLERLDLPRLSARLANGQYRVSYSLNADRRHLCGDLFLLSTSTTDDVPSDEPDVSHRSGVRVVTLGRDLLRDLAHASRPSSTLYGAIDSTLPHLGPPGRGPGRDTSSRTSTSTATSTGEAALAADGGTETSDEASKDEQSVSEGAEEAEDSEQETSNGKGLDLDSAKVLGDLEEPPEQNPSDGERTDDDRTSRTSDATGRDEETSETRDEHDSSDERPDSSSRSVPPLEKTAAEPVVEHRPERGELQRILDRVERVLESHDIELAEPPSVEEVELGPRIMRIYIRPRMDVTVSSIERRSEDIALHVGAGGGDIRIHRATGKRGAVALDLPIPEFSYEVDYGDVVEHPSFESARRDKRLGFCAGIRIDGTPAWVDLAGMPHMLVGGATGSGKTVFLNNLIMTLALQHTPNEVDLRLATSKAYDFAAFTDLPHANDEVVEPTSGTRLLVDDLVAEMERRNDLLTEARAHKLDFYNDKVRSGAIDGRPLPHVVAVVDEYAATIKSFDDSSERDDFERNITRLAQEARATGIHLVLCMQRPDAEVVEGTIKSNITHRFALKLAAKVDSRVVLDQNGAETLLGKGDMLYLDEQGELDRLQVPLLEGDLLRDFIEAASQGSRVG